MIAQKRGRGRPPLELLPDDGTRWIKRYGQRRLYDVRERTYITKEGVERLCAAGERVVIVAAGKAGDYLPAIPSVYFLQEGSLWRDGPEGESLIKIGWAVRVPVRLQTLQVGNPRPLILLATLPGPQKMERHIHEQFSWARVTGEWFRPHPTLLSFIEEAKRFKP